MKYRKLDASGDYTIGSGADFYHNEPNAVAQAAKTRLALFSGEWFLDTTDGTPWRTEVLGKYSKETYDTVIQQRIIGTQGVLSIAAYASVYDGAARNLHVEATLDTIYGQAYMTGTV